MRIKRFALSVGAVLIVTFSFPRVPRAWGQTTPTEVAPATVKLQAELLKTIDANHARVGDAVTAGTVTPLELDGQKFPPGVIVKGHVAEAQPSRLLLVFDGVEVEKKAPLSVGLSLRAVVMPRPQTPQAQSSDRQLSPRAEGGGGTTGAIPEPHTGRGDLLRSPEAAAQDSADTIFDGSRPVAVSPRTVETRNGGVIGLPGVRLIVSTDPKVGAAFEADKDHKLKLEKGLQMMFVIFAK